MMRRKIQPLRRPTVTLPRGPDAEERAASITYFARPTQGGGGLALGGIVKRITWTDSETRQELQTAPQGPDKAVMRQQQGPQSEEVVRARYRQAQLLEQRFQVLLGALLAMETRLVMKWFATSRESYGELVVFLRFLYPFGGQALHTTPCPGTQPRAETNRPP